MSDETILQESREDLEEDARRGVPIDLMTAVPGLNPRDMSVLIISGLGKGISLNTGVDNGDGTATLLERDLEISGGLRMRFPPGASGPHSFAITVISTDGHVRTGSLTVEPGLAPLEAGLRFSIEPPVVMDDQGQVGFPVAISFSRGMGRMVGDVNFALTGVPSGVHLTNGSREEKEGDDGPWRMKMDDLRDLNLVVPDGQQAFDVELTVEARGQSGGRLVFRRGARVVPPGARAQETPPATASLAPDTADAAPTESVGEEAAVVVTSSPQAGPPVIDWLTGNGVFTFASGHGGDLFEGGYGWSLTASPLIGDKTGPEDGETALRLLAGGPVIDGPEPVVW